MSDNLPGIFGIMAATEASDSAYCLGYLPSREAIAAMDQKVPSAARRRLCLDLMSRRFGRRLAKGAF